MTFIQLCIVLGLACLANAACKHPTPVENFSQKNFSGTWATIAFNMLDPRDEELFQDARCPTFSLEDGENDRNRYKFHALNKSSEILLIGTYSVPDPNIGILRQDAAAGTYPYVYTVMCTDYTTFSATYSCLEVGTDYTTEWILLNVRNINDYGEVIAKKELEKCYLDLPIKSATQLTKRPYVDCEGKL